jgi:hypothetical protein
MMSALPAALKISIAPPLLSWTTTMLFTVLPAVSLMFEVPGGAPTAAGYAVRKVVVLTLVTVRLSTIAVAPVGMPFTPVTCHRSVSFPVQR